MKFLDNVREELKKMKANWETVVGDREDWKEVLRLAKAHVEL